LLPGFYYACRAVVRVLLKLVTRWQVSGEENVPSQGGLLILANHIHLADPILIAASISRKPEFMAKEQLFHSPLSRFFVRSFGAFPVRRGRIDRRALRQAHRILAKGQALVIFPEGRRSHNHQLQPASLGAARIASNSGALILPVGISGSEKLKGIAWLWRRPQLTVNIGRPFSPPPVERRLTKKELAELTEAIMSRIAELLPPEYRGDHAEQRE